MHAITIKGAPRAFNIMFVPSGALNVLELVCNPTKHAHFKFFYAKTEIRVRRTAQTSQSAEL